MINGYREEKGSMINDRKVREVADRLELIEKSKVDNICTMLREGANIGVEGEGRWPSWGRNNPTVYQFGEWVADSLQTAVKYGIMYGPLKREDLPWKDFKVSPMTVRLKPNSRARITMDLSYPHKIMLGRGEHLTE